MGALSSQLILYVLNLLSWVNLFINVGVLVSASASSWSLWPCVTQLWSQFRHWIRVMTYIILYGEWQGTGERKWIGIKPVSCSFLEVKISCTSLTGCLWRWERRLWRCPPLFPSVVPGHQREHRSAFLHLKCLVTLIWNHSHLESLRFCGGALLHDGRNIYRYKSVHVQSLSCVWLFVTPWTVAHQAPPLSMGFPRLEYQSKLPFPSRGSSQPRDRTCISCLAGGFFFFFLMYLFILVGG